MQESKSCALPLGHTPIFLFSFQPLNTRICFGWGGRIRTYAMLESESNALPLGDTPSHLKRKIYGVIEGNRTLDLQSHNLAFYQLNYDHHIGAPRRIRTFDLCLRRALLYPAELWKQMEQVKGIGPSQPAWKASVLPLNYTCIMPYKFNTA